MNNDPSTLVKCPHCNVMVKPERLEKHVRRVHSPTAETAGASRPRRKGIRSGPGLHRSPGWGWYRDSNGDLWFGSPDEFRREFHLVDTGPSYPKPASPEAREEAQKALKEAAFALHGFICPVCQNLVPKDQVRGHARQHVSVAVCPVCNELIHESKFGMHMERHHANWCPICKKNSRDLALHLVMRHRVKMTVSVEKYYPKKWESKRVFKCEFCKERLSAADVPQHQEQHKAESPPTKAEMKRKKVSGSQKISCPICHQKVMRALLSYHMSARHPEAPSPQTSLPKSGEGL